MITPDLKGVVFYPYEEETEFKQEREIIKPPISSNEPDLIEYKRAMRRWKQSFGYYCLHPEKFGFNLRYLK